MTHPAGSPPPPKGRPRQADGGTPPAPGYQRQAYHRRTIPDEAKATGPDHCRQQKVFHRRIVAPPGPLAKADARSWPNWVVGGLAVAGLAARLTAVLTVVVV